MMRFAFHNYSANRAIALFFLGGTIALLPSPIKAQQAVTSERPQISGPLSIEKAVQTGLRENLIVRAAQSDSRAAAADTRAARSMTRLQISANTYLTHGDTSNILSSSPGSFPTNSNAVPSRPFADQNLTLMIPLSTGGRLNSLVRAASERERAAFADAGGVQAETALQIRETYYRALLAGEIVKAAQARIEADTALLANTRAQVEAGKGIEASLLRVEAELADAQRALTNAKNDQAKTLLDLKAAMGVRLDSEITLSDTLAFVPPRSNLASSLKEANGSRPELKAARSRTASAEAQIAAAKGSFQPQIYGTAMADAFASSHHSTGTYTLGLTISFPLLDGGQRRAETDRARAGKERAEAEAQEAELRVAKEVQQAWLDMDTAAQNYLTAQAALKAAQSAYDVTALRVQNQKAILLEQLDSLAALTQARTNLAMALYDHSTAVARLQRAVGKF